MNKDQFYTYLKEGVQGTAEEQEALKAILAKYPYFQSARVLLSKSSYLSGHHEFDQVLQQAAIHVGDRSYLFHEHTKELLAKSIADVEQEIDAMEEEDLEEGIAEQVQDENQQAEASNAALDEKNGSASNSESDAEKDQQGHHQEEEKETEEEQEVLADERSVSREDKRKFDEMDELGQAVLLGALNSSIEQEVSVQNQTNEAEEKLSGVEVSSVEQLDEDETAEELSAFASWVYKRAIGMNYGDGLTEVKSSVNEEQESQSSQQSAQVEKEVSAPMSKTDLIDRFIQNEPKITPRRAMDAEAPEVVAKALVQDEEWVTETLAQVYAKQGNLGKARKAYKLLALKYPEKSVYFANQIKKLGNQSNK
jgi:chemotaxis protein histidine kinase CheA